MTAKLRILAVPSKIKGIQSLILDCLLHELYCEQYEMWYCFLSSEDKTDSQEYHVTCKASDNQIHSIIST